MKVLMFGWELPPYNAGGLGVACLGLSRALRRNGVDIAFVLPRNIPAQFQHQWLLFADNFLSPLTDCACVRDGKFSYAASGESVCFLSSEEKHGGSLSRHRAHTLIDEVFWYARAARVIARSVAHDVIHAHDWLTFPAAIAAKRESGKPLVVHVHATEFDRTGHRNVNQEVYNIEREGLHAADRIVAVSNYTKGILVRHYGVPAEKIEVVHNGVDEDDTTRANEQDDRLINFKHAGNKIVLFVGRITIQKGPDYFLSVARRVLEYEPRAYFVMAGSGDMERQIIEGAAWLGIGDRFLFAGFTRGTDLGKLYQIADLVVMPSVSEPFGIVPLEAALNGAPVLVSKQSGVSEVLRHTLKVDFWDIDEMTNQIVSALRHKPLREALSQSASQEVRGVTWRRAADALAAIYHSVVLFFNQAMAIEV